MKPSDGLGHPLLFLGGDYAGGMKSLLVVWVLLCGTAWGVELRVSAPALQRGLERQLFNQAGPDGVKNRHYLRGSAEKGCSVYEEEPHLSFRDAVAPEVEARIVVTVKTHAKVGFGKNCFGISVTAESTVSFIPQADGESIGFRDAKVEKLSENKELNLLLEPFLAKRMPQEMKVNAANLLRTLLVKAPDQTGYTLTLTSLELHSMRVEGDALLVDLDAKVRVD